MEFSLDKIALLQSTAYYRTKNITTDYFLLRNHCKTVPFPLTLQTCRPEFLTSTRILTLRK